MTHGNPVKEYINSGNVYDMCIIFLFFQAMYKAVNLLSLGRQVVETSLHVLVVVINLFLKERSFRGEILESGTQSYHLLLPTLAIQALVADILRHDGKRYYRVF